MPSQLPSRGVPQVLATLPGWASEDNGLLRVRGVDDGVLYVEDGVPVYDRMDALSGIAPDPESIGTINVLTGYIPPEYGLKSGAVIDFSTRCIPTTFTTKGPATPSAFPVRVVAALLVSPLVSHVAMYRRHIQADLRSTAADTPLFATSDRQHDRLGLLGSATYERNRHTAKAGFEIARLRLQEDFRFRRDVGSGGRARYPLWRAAHVPRRRCAWVCALVLGVRSSM